MKPIRLWTLCLLAGTVTACLSPQITYRDIRVDAPFEMPAIREVHFPDRDFVLTDYGAVADGRTLCTEAFAAAIEACSAAGNGHIVVPAGEWLTSPIHLRSHVDLHLAEGSFMTGSSRLANRSGIRTIPRFPINGIPTLLTKEFQPHE